MIRWSHQRIINLIDLTTEKRTLTVAYSYVFGHCNYLAAVSPILSHKEYMQIQSEICKVLKTVFKLSYDERCEISYRKLLRRAGWPTFQDNQKRLALKSINKIFQDQFPRKLYSILRLAICLYNEYEETSKPYLCWQERFPSKLDNNAQGPDFFDDFFPYFYLDHSMFSNLSNSEKNRLFPITAMKYFNELPESIRDQFPGTKFEQLLNIHFYDNCPHASLTSCSWCKNQQLEFNLQDYQAIYNEVVKRKPLLGDFYRDEKDSQTMYNIAVESYLNDVIPPITDKDVDQDIEERYNELIKPTFHSFARKTYFWEDASFGVNASWLHSNRKST